MLKNGESCAKYIKEMDVDMVDFKIIDLMGRWRHVSVPARKVTEEVLGEGFGFDASNYGFLKVEKSDMIFKPDSTTAFEEEWDDFRVLSLICNIFTTDAVESRFSQDPRNISQKAEKYLKELGLADELRILPEFEFYVFDQADFESRAQGSYFVLNSRAHGWTPGDGHTGYGNRKGNAYQAAPPGDQLFMFRNSLVKMLEAGGMPVKYHHHEVGAPGQVEIEVEFGTITQMADHTMMLKYIARNLATRIGKTVTFMPKPVADEAGSGLHIHFKLYKDGKNIFADPAGYSGLSKTAMHFIGGLLKHSKGLMALTNPSTNSYKRLIPGFEAPVSIVYSTGNRSAAIRIPAYAMAEDDKRFEFRPPDATCNPYLSYSAMLMAGIDGIRNKIDPEKEGFGPFDVNFFDLPKEELEKIQKLPCCLEEALEELEKDHDYLTEGGVFPKELIEHWIKVKTENEIEPIRSFPHPMEYVMYYDL